MASILKLNRESPRENRPRRGIVRETPGVDRRQNTFVFPKCLSRTLDLAGAKAAGALSNLLLADGDEVDLEVVEL